MPNCVAKPKGEKRSYIADEINQIKDISSVNLRRPIDRGYVVNWDLQREIWDHVFAKVLKINPKNCHLVLLEPPFNLPNIMWEQDVVVFERFQFKSALICNPATRALHRVFAADGGGGGGGEGEGSSSLHAKARCGVVVDAVIPSFPFSKVRCFTFTFD